MTAKRYRLFIGGRKFDYTYDEDVGVTRLRLPGTQQFVTTQSPTAEDARRDVRGLLEVFAKGNTKRHG